LPAIKLPGALKNLKTSVHFTGQASEVITEIKIHRFNILFLTINARGKPGICRAKTCEIP
jgi:hypothetical protein